MDLVHGVDVSVYEPRVDWRVLRSQEFRFALIRATSGVGYVDPKFASHWEGARAEGILRGAYHYLIGGQDAKQQANLFISTVGPDKGELPPIVDLEDAYNEGVPNNVLISKCKEVLDLIEKAFGLKPMVYSRKTYLDAHFTQFGKAPAWAGDYDIWVAQYPWNYDPKKMPNVNMPQQPPGWKDWKFWQYSETAIVEGVTDENNQPTRIDLNWFRGTEDDLYKFAKVRAPKEKTYTTKTGDTLEGIAAKFDLSLSELLKANPSLLRAGRQLTIPGRVKISPPPATTKPAQPQPTSGGGKTSGTSTGITSTKPVVTHTVKSGDTLLGIALSYRTSIEKIMELNPQITNRNIIHVGQVIVIPSS